MLFVRRALCALACVPLLAAGCNSFNVERYRAPTYAPPTAAKFALMPLVLKSAQKGDKKILTWSPGFMVERVTLRALSDAQYLPAAAEVERQMVATLKDYEVVRSAQVTAAMADVKVRRIRDAAVEIAKRTASTAVILVEVEDFVTEPAGLDSAHARGRTNVTCYAASGEVLWSLSAEVYKGPVGSTAAPTLKQYLEYAMGKMESEVRQMLAQ